MSRPTRGTLLPAVLLCFTCVAGCGALGGESASSSSTSPTATGPSNGAPAQGSSSPAPGQPTPADPSASTDGARLGQVVVTRTSASKGQRVEMTLYPVQRDGTVSHLNLTLSSPAEAVDHVQVAAMLSDNNYEAIDETGFAADGLTLVDGKNSKLYLVASDGQGTCLCSRGLSSVFLQDGALQLFSATFAAPPSDVTTVDVRVPRFGTVKDVPVQ